MRISVTFNDGKVVRGELVQVDIANEWFDLITDSLYTIRFSSCKWVTYRKGRINLLSKWKQARKNMVNDGNRD